ncbi:hypothetical protein [Lentilitoribacter sp. EG35]|uniref:hypothetical protein n=1 Tax=Lentilitoribacter sp. EG35 TaxID=3234192 RepID=UPI003460E954
MTLLARLSALKTGVKIVMAAVVASAATFTIMSIYDAFIDDPAVRKSYRLEMRAHELAEANKRMSEMLENNNDFAQMSECDRFNELAGASGLPLDDC